jgi:hypothetical protein
LQEGVPLHAIARATKIPSSDLREQLIHAQHDGRLLELPRNDWSSGFPRDQRALQLSRLMVEDKTALHIVVREAFGISPAQARILLLMIQSSTLCREAMDNSLTVQVFFLRKRLVNSA